MKLSFTKKLILDAIEKNESDLTVQYVSYLKEDYIERLMRLTIVDNAVVSIYFSSNDFGTASWVRGMGVVESHRWESEDDLRAVSYLARHYPAPIEDGFVSPDYAIKHIIPDVLDYLIDPNLQHAVQAMLNNSPDDFFMNWDDILSRGKRLSSECIDELIAAYERKLQETPVYDREPDAAPAAGSTPSLFTRLRGFFMVPSAVQPKIDSDAREVRSYLDGARHLSRKIKKL